MVNFKFKNKYTIGLSVFGVFFFSLLFFSSGLNSKASACIVDGAAQAEIDLAISPDIAEKKDSVLKFTYNLAVTNCDNKKELDGLEWYIYDSGGSLKVPLLEENGSVRPISYTKWSAVTGTAKAYYISIYENWRPYTDIPGRSGSISFAPEVKRKSDNKVLKTGSSVRITLAGTLPANNTPANNAPGNGCTGTGCGTVGSSDFDTNVGLFENPINIESFPELVLFVMKGFIFLIGIMAVLIIIIGGVRMVLSQGNQESITKGKNTIIWAVAGLIVALLSFSLVSIVQNLLSKP